MKLTPWFSVMAPPLRNGIYERRHVGDSRIWHQYWSGRAWRFCGEDVWDAHQMRNVPSGYQDGTWRGLAEESK
jgi:hypothetical protein